MCHDVDVVMKRASWYACWRDMVCQRQGMKSWEKAWETRMHWVRSWGVRWEVTIERISEEESASRIAGDPTMIE